MFRRTINLPNAVASKLDGVGASKNDTSLSAQRVTFDTEGRKIQRWYRIKVLSPERPLERLVIEAIDRAGKPVGAFDSVMPGNRLAAYVFVGSNVASLALHLEPCDCGDAASATLRPISSLEFVWRSLKSTFLRDVIFRRPFTFLRSFLRPPQSLFVLLDFRRPQTFVSEEEIYRWWIGRRESVAVKRILASSHPRSMERPPISILMTLRDPHPTYLRKAIESVMRQTTPNWELCIATDASTSAAARQILSAVTGRSKRAALKISAPTGEMSAGLNTALALSSAPFALHLDQQDMLAPVAVQVFSEYFANRSDARLAYSDDDRIDETDRRFLPYFKPQFSRELLYSYNYFDRATVYHTETLKKIGGWRDDFDGARDYDANLRMVEAIDEAQIGHIPAVLYHRREPRRHLPAAAATRPAADPRVIAAGKRALEQHLERRAVNARVETVTDAFYRIRYALPELQPKVSIIIPFRDRAELLRECVSSVLTKTTYRNYEIVLVDNGSVEPATADLLRCYSDDARIHVLSHPGPFNYSALNNRAAEWSSADYLCLLNNDTIVITPDWLEDMVGYASQPGVGCVGAKLYYANARVQHAGVVLDPSQVTRHVFLNRSRQDSGYFGRLLVASNYSAVTGACLLVKRSIFIAAGGLDEKEFFIACNDIDLCLNVRSLGYRNIVTPFAELFHFESSSRGYENTPEKRLRFAKEMQVMRDRHGDDIARDPCYSPHLAGAPDDFLIAVDRM
jgi:GT2 family glycosyltransferase